MTHPPDSNQLSERNGPRINWRRRGSIVVLLTVIVGAYWHVAQQAKNWLSFERAGSAFAQGVGRPAFDLKKVAVNRREIHSGGPPKDGIPALTNPRMTPADQASYLQPTDRVIGVALNGEARAYPLAILNFHEIINDRVGKTKVAVTYCPLCDSAVAFDRQTPLGEREFGVSGLLFNSNVLMYDRGGKPESLWSQVKTKGISGPAIGAALEQLPLELTTWGEWTERHLNTLVMSNATGHPRDYRQNPYDGYFQQDDLMFPAKPKSKRLPAKERVLGVNFGDSQRAYPESAFQKGDSRITETIDGKQLTIEYHPDSRTLRVVESDETIRWMYSLWFAWYAFYPETTIYSGAPLRPQRQGGIDKAAIHFAAVANWCGVSARAMVASTATKANRRARD
jgi:hypothetical protein